MGIRVNEAQILLRRREPVNKRGTNPLTPSCPQLLGALGAAP